MDAKFGAVWGPHTRTIPAALLQSGELSPAHDSRIALAAALDLARTGPVTKLKQIGKLPGIKPWRSSTRGGATPQAQGRTTRGRGPRGPAHG